MIHQFTLISEGLIAIHINLIQSSSAHHAGKVRVVRILLVWLNLDYARRSIVDMVATMSSGPRRTSRRGCGRCALTERRRTSACKTRDIPRRPVVSRSGHYGGVTRLVMSLNVDIEHRRCASVGVDNALVHVSIGRLMFTCCQSRCTTCVLSSSKAFTSFTGPLLLVEILSEP